MIHDEICTYELCKLAEEKGFPQHIGNDAYIEENEYDNEYEVGCNYPIQFIPDYLPTIAAPTQSLLQRWLREEKGLHITIAFDQNEFWWQIENLATGDYEYGEALGFDTYELALEDALKYVLRNLV
jgi:hypothetical protein